MNCGISKQFAHNALGGDYYFAVFGDKFLPFDSLYSVEKFVEIFGFELADDNLHTVCRAKIKIALSDIFKAAFKANSSVNRSEIFYARNFVYFSFRNRFYSRSGRNANFHFL